MIRIEFTDLDEAIKVFNGIRDCENFTHGNLTLCYEDSCTHFIVAQSFYNDADEEVNRWWITDNYDYGWIYYNYFPHHHRCDDYSEDYNLRKNEKNG